MPVTRYDTEWVIMWLLDYGNVERRLRYKDRPFVCGRRPRAFPILLDRTFRLHNTWLAFSLENAVFERDIAMI